MNLRAQIATSLLLLVAPTAGAQSFFEISGSGPQGSVVVLTPSEVRPPALQEIVLLPLDAMGRTALTSLQRGETQRRADIPGAARLRLPEGMGSLYKYCRPGDPLIDPGSVYGYFIVGPLGRARRVFELSGTGVLLADDPLPGRVAIHASGTCMLVATSVAAGGDLWEIDLTNGSVQNRTATLGPMDFGLNGLVLLDTWGFGVSSSGPVRFERLPGAQATTVAMPLTNTWFGPDVVRSADESTVAFLAGADGLNALVFTARRSGNAILASDAPMTIPGAGFLPEVTTGPHLALSTDGSWVAWRSQGETFARETGAGTHPPGQHLTGAPDFDATLNDTGVIAFFDPDSVILFAGRGASDGIGRGDLFRFDLVPGGGGAITNLSQTSEIIGPPYDYGYLHTADGVVQMPEAPNSYLALDTEAPGTLLCVRTDGAAPLLQDVRSVGSVEVAGTYVVAEVVRPPGVNDPLRESLNLVQIPSSGTAPIVLPLPPGCHLSRTAGLRNGSLYASVLEFAGGGRLGRVPVPSTSGAPLSVTPLPLGPTVGLSLTGSILSTVRVGTDQVAFDWSSTGTQVLRTIRSDGFLLPGL